MKPKIMIELLTRLKKTYGQAECALNHTNAFELLAATILSAQCTDVRVNLVTPALFARFPTPEAMAAASLEELEALVRSTGFFRNKAKSLQGMAQRVYEVYGNRVPDSMDELLTLPGVARKTANVVLGVFYGIAHGVVVDTHVARLSGRLGLTDATSATAIEQALMAKVPATEWIQFSHLLIHHGRAVCAARQPACERCELSDLCPTYAAATGKATAAGKGGAVGKGKVAGKGKAAGKGQIAGKKRAADKIQVAGKGGAAGKSRAGGKGRAASKLKVASAPARADSIS